MKRQVKIGLESFLEEPSAAGKIGLLCNQASVNHDLRHAADLLREKFGARLTTLFGPQHGIRGEVQDNMIETRHGIDAATNLPVYSLYSETREPTAEMLSEVDVLVCDLVDIGCRVYTFMYTIANCMKICGRLGKKIVVCDRPNPLNGIAVEGNLLDASFASFVGQFPIPMRHSMTMGELAMMFQQAFHIECDLTVVKMTGWEREMWFDEIDVPWVIPSPNMPTLETAVVFPGTVILEGTQLSEGRGTTRPFEIIGAPYLEAEKYAAALNNLNLPGIYFRAHNFIPTFQKQQHLNCGGVHLHVVDRRIYQPFLTGVALVKTAFEMSPQEFAWKNPPYEYVYDKNPFDVINGGEEIRRFIENKSSLESIKEWCLESSAGFAALKKEFELY